MLFKMLAFNVSLFVHVCVCLQRKLEGIISTGSVIICKTSLQWWGGERERRRREEEEGSGKAASQSLPASVPT